MGLRGFFRIVWARRLIVVLSLVSTCTAAALATLLLPSQYEATSSVLLEMVDIDAGSGTAVDSPFDEVYVRAQMEMVSDDDTVDRVLDKLGWTTSPELQTVYAQQVTDGDPDFRSWLRGFIKGSIRASMQGESAVMNISYTNPSPEAARVIADTVRDAFVASEVSDRQEEARKSADFLDQQALQLAAQLQAADQRKTAFEREHGVTLTDFGDLADARLAELSRTARLAPTPVSRRAQTDPSYQVNQLDAAIATQAQTLGDSHPAIQALRRQRAALAKYSGTSQTAVADPGALLASALGAAQAQVLASATESAEARRLQLAVIQLRTRYIAIASRAADLRRSAQTETAGLRPLAEASTPTEKIFPNIPFIIGSALLLGLAVGAMVAFIVEQLGRRVRGSDDLMLGDVPVFQVSAEPAPARRRRGWLARLLRRRRTSADTGALVPA